LEIRRARSALAVAILAGLTGACSGWSLREAGPGDIHSAIAMNDPRAAKQLIAGFYPVEMGAWRWTADKFAVVLKSPDGAAHHGATLLFRMTVPDSVIGRLHDVTLSAQVRAVGGQSLTLDSQRFDKPGTYTYSRDIDARLLGNHSVRIDFSLDKSMAPTPPEQRQLGVVAKAIALRAK